MAHCAETSDWKTTNKTNVSRMTRYFLFVLMVIMGEVTKFKGIVYDYAVQEPSFCAKKMDGLAFSELFQRTKSRGARRASNDPT
jgi:hypothetical protein